MTEDELYRASTQYRLWNFTPERLASLRASTNALAVESVKAAIERKRAAKQAASTDVSATASDADGNGSGSGNGKTVASKVDKEVQCLTSVEEKKLVDFYCSNVLKFAALPPLELPINVTVYCGSSCYQTHKIANDSLGHSRPIPQALLPLPLPHGLPSQADYARRTLPRQQDRKLPHPS